MAGKSGCFFPLSLIWSFTIPFKSLEACWEEHPVSSHLLPSSRWNKGGKIFSDWVCVCGWPLLCFIPQLAPERIHSKLKELTPHVCVSVYLYVFIYLSICWSFSGSDILQFLIWSWPPAVKLLDPSGSRLTYGQLFYKVTPSFAKLQTVFTVLVLQGFNYFRFMACPMFIYNLT